MNAPVRIEAGDLALLWQLAARAREAESEQTLGFTMVNETLSFIAYRQAAWWRAPSHAPGAVAAVSGLPQSDPGAPYVQWLGEMFRVQVKQAAQDAGGVAAGAAAGASPHAARGPGDAASPEAGNGAGSAALSSRPCAFTSAHLPATVAADWSTWWPMHALWVPLVDRSGRSFGGVVFVRDNPWTHTEEVMLAELAQVWAHALGAFAPRATLTARARLLLRPGKVRRRALAVFALLCVVPVPLSVLAPAEVTPKDPFVVRAPLDGVIDRLYTQPNQRVRPGTPLFALDSTTLASRYAVANKNFDTAQEEYRQTAQLAVTEDKDRLDMALRKGKLDESQVELDYTARELARVRVTADRAGVAVFADPNDWTGKAVSVGEKVMLLADPANVELTAYLPVADNIDVKPGATLTLYPKSSPDRKSVV